MTVSSVANNFGSERLHRATAENPIDFMFAVGLRPSKSMSGGAGFFCPIHSDIAVNPASILKVFDRRIIWSGVHVAGEHLREILR